MYLDKSSPVKEINLISLSVEVQGFLEEGITDA
jgi:hypothetical protein